MKRLIAALLTLTFSVPSAFAVAQAETLEEEDLLNYFIFEAGEWWEYENYIEWAESYDIDEDILVDDEDDEEANVSRVESWTCSVYQCFAMAGGGVLLEYFIEDGNIYMNRIAGTNIEDFTVLSLDGISGATVGEIEALFYGYDSISGLLVEKDCELDFDSSYEFEGYTAGLLTHNCSIRFTDEARGEETLFVTSEEYLENVGLIYKEVRMYENSDWQYTTYQPLYDTSIDIEDLAEDEEVELSEDEEEVEDEEVELSEVDEELLSQDLKDYFGQEEGTWWEYESTLDSDVLEISEASTSITRRSDCDDFDVCYADEDPSGVSTKFIDNGVLYYDQINGEDLSKNYTAINLEGYTDEIAEEDYAFFAIEGSKAGASVTCEYSFVETYEWESVSDSAILELCTLAGETLEDYEFELIVETTYLKGIGMVSSESRLYTSGVIATEGSTTLLSTSLTAESPFDDLDVEEENFPAINYLYGEEIIGGYDDGTFKPDNTVNRAELLKILVEGQGITPDENVYKNCFPDVTTDWYAKYVCYAKEEGWVSGYPDGTFRPADPVNKVEALKMLLNSQDVEMDSEAESSFSDVNEEDWFAEYVAKAEELGILEEDGNSFNPDNDRTRAGICEELYRLLVY